MRHMMTRCRRHHSCRIMTGCRGAGKNGRMTRTFGVISHRRRQTVDAQNDKSRMRIANEYLVEGMPERNGDGFGRPWHSNMQVENFFDILDLGGGGEEI
ncbi:hypothetical protein L3X38_018282 [Prunus dulcis]|uniref:Uncharacterized protein n=1 Tax=Prunus dulcis TaxID=3755 RepID=A0AAD4ZAL2_PRUDU|nr:hypothetical protein L3X38_018282 [Prunus dulcis]